ncbi:MAG: ATP-binding cassette domain-containing protein [Oscillospiraceae bacterium]|nr:ATP-binding cassette domain-containing protein [Oscillospiraceae bacterium]
MVVLDNVSKTFKDKTVLQKTSLTIESGRITGFIGRNGSGKTVLFKLICGLMLPTTGTVTVDGVRVGKDRDFAPDTGVLIETPSFISYESGLRNLRDLAAIRRKITTGDVREAIRLVGLDPDDRKRVGKYSLGMRQRLGIAQAIMERPSLIILDEPMNGLDRSGVEDMRTVFAKLRDEGKTILLASHAAEDIEILCDAVYELENGTVSGPKLPA